MSKDYLCKDCPNNNNGWCKKRKIQGLKNITECQDKPTIHNDEDLDLEDNRKLNTGAYKQFGKREMFHTIQMQMIGIDEDNEVDKYTVLKQVMVNLEKVLLIEEHIHGIATEYTIDQDIIESSKAISKAWLKDVGEYKGK